MFEDAQFWGLLITVVAGYAVNFKFLFDIRDRVEDNANRLTKLETETRLEFEKCRLHRSCIGGNVDE